VIGAKFGQSMRTPPHSRRNSAVQSPSNLAAPKLSNFPVADLLAALFIETLPEGTTIDDIKKTMCNAVEAVLTDKPPPSPSPAKPSPSFRRVKEEYACQVPTFLKTLNQVHNGRRKRKFVGTENSSESPKRKRKLSSIVPDPASFSEEEFSEDNESNNVASILRN